MDASKINTTALAYIGDAVYEVFVRERILAVCPPNVDALHKKAIAYVCAEGQASAIKQLMKEYDSSEAPVKGAFVLTEDEAALLKRARNHKSASKPKNVDPMTYKWATAFEALAGRLYLDGESERLAELFEAMAAITEKGRKR